LSHAFHGLNLNIQYFYGIKIETANGRYTFVWRVEKNKAKLKEKIAWGMKDIYESIA